MSTIKQAIDGAIGNEDEIKHQRELLTLLAESSESKANLMENELKAYLRTAGTEENKSIPISEILGEYFEVRVSTEDSMGDVVTKVKSAIESILSGNILEGVTSLIGDTLSTLVGSSSSTETTRKQYFVGVEGLSMIRYDVSYWVRSITIESIKKTAEKSIICILTKSSIDVGTLKFNTFLNIYQTLLKKNESMTTEQLISEINEAKKVYKALLSETNTVDATNENIDDIVIDDIADLGDYLTYSIPYENTRKLDLI